ncbi:hypothetical protein LX32DRAFT_13780 [Colletotrichum zoysiae]|uniref:Uncharacterized protein n=1 Tax=Colletotrichum zoysiae TaxID=1216348 RepID=A0AAD9HEY5_9PEZI|nr:hypothetical protein LX32DRAFT_13780 [Colletotrichum zoysiae]
MLHKKDEKKKKRKKRKKSRLLLHNLPCILRLSPLVLMSGSTHKRLERRIIPRPQKLTRKSWYARGDRPLSIVQIVQLLLFSIRLSEVEEIDGFPSCHGKALFQGTAFARRPGTPIAPLAEDDLPHLSIPGTRTLKFKGSCLLPGSWFEVVRSLGRVLRNSPRSSALLAEE